MTTQIYFAEKAYINQSQSQSYWLENVRFEIRDGVIESITANTTPAEATYLSGPVVPSLANLHSHAFQRVMAGLAEISIHPNDSFWSWRNVMYNVVHRLSPSDVRVIASQLYIDMLKAGYTQVAEFHYLHHQSSGQAYDQLDEMALQLTEGADVAGIGLTLLPVLYSHSGFKGQAPLEGQSRFINDTEQYLRLYRQCEKALSNNPLHQIGLCFHSLRAVTHQQIKEALSEVTTQTPIHIHIAEQEKEVQDCLNWSGQRPVQWLVNEIGLDDRWNLIHATHLTNDEMLSIVKSHAVVGLCPTTEANLGDGIFAATDFIQAQGRWGIGSDSHVSLSIVEELRTLEYGQRLRDQQRNRLYSDQQKSVGEFLYQQALQGGNQATQVKLGLSVGMRGDFIVLDDKHPFIAASRGEDIFNRWLFACNENLVRSVYVAGHPIITDFKHQHEESTCVEFTNVLKKLFNS